MCYYDHPFTGTESEDYRDELASLCHRRPE